MTQQLNSVIQLKVASHHIKPLIRVCEKISGTAALTFEKDRMQIDAVQDYAYVRMRATLPASSSFFLRYVVPQETVLLMDTEDLAEAFLSHRNGLDLNVYLTKDKMYVKKDTGCTSYGIFEVPVYSPVPGLESRVKIEDSIFASTLQVQLKATPFMEAVNECGKIDSHMKLARRKNPLGIEVSATGEINAMGQGKRYVMNFYVGRVEPIQGIKFYSNLESFTDRFALGYLARILNIIKGNSEWLILECDSEMPLHIRCNIFGGHLDLWFSKEIG